MSRNSIDRAPSLGPEFQRVLDESSGTPTAWPADRRFMHELDFATILIRMPERSVADLEVARTTLGLPPSAYRVRAANVRADLEAPLYRKRIQRWRAMRDQRRSLGPGDRCIRGAMGVQALEATADLFIALISRNFVGVPDSDGIPAEIPEEALMAFARFANGSLRRAHPPDSVSSSMGLFNAEPNGPTFMLFAEFSEEAWFESRARRAAGDRTSPLARSWRWWRAMTQVFAGLIDVMTSVYWEPGRGRRWDAYRPAAYRPERCWTDAELRDGIARSRARGLSETRERWGRSLCAALVDEPLSGGDASGESPHP